MNMDAGRKLDYRLEAAQMLANLAHGADITGAQNAKARYLYCEVIKRLPWIEEIVSSRLKSPLKAKARLVRGLLMIGIYELCYLGGKPHGVINSIVELVKSSGFNHMAGMVNAVLRGLARDPQPPSKLSNMPLWFEKRLTADYGKEKAIQIANAMFAESYIDFTTKSAGLEIADLDCIRLDEFSLRSYEARGITELEGYKAGEIWVQGYAASIPAKMIMANMPKSRVLDMCAAPGGKTMQLLAAGHKVTALEKSESRAERLAQNCQRTGLIPEQVVIKDAMEYEGEIFDCALLDAPCTASGLITSKPDIMYTKNDRDVLEMRSLQMQLLRKVSKLVRSGGEIYYSTCSIFKDEGEVNIAEFLHEFPQFSLVPIKVAADSVIAPLINTEGMFRSLPSDFSDKGGIEGFFMAILRKN